MFPRIRLIDSHPDAEFIGLWDPREDLRAVYAHEHGIHVFASEEELLAAEPNLVILEGLDHHNPAVATRLARAGIDLLIEKPGASQLGVMRELVDAVGETPVHAQIGYMLRNSPTMPWLREVLASGVLGDITLARFHATSPVGCAAEIWQSLPGDIGGVTYTDGCHMVDVIQELFGQPQAVQALVKRLSTGPVARSQFYKKDIFAGLGTEEEFGIGTLVHEDVSASVFDYGDKLVTFDVTGWKACGWVEGWRIELFGTNGTVYSGLMPAWGRLNVASPRAGYSAGWHTFEHDDDDLDPAEFTLVPDVTYTTELFELIDRLVAGDRSQDGLRQGLRVIETLDAVFRSSRADGARVSL